MLARALTGHSERDGGRRRRGTSFLCSGSRELVPVDVGEHAVWDVEVAMSGSAELRSLDYSPFEMLLHAAGVSNRARSDSHGVFGAPPALPLAVSDGHQGTASSPGTCSIRTKTEPNQSANNDAERATSAPHSLHGRSSPRHEKHGDRHMGRIRRSLFACVPRVGQLPLQNRIVNSV